MDFNKSLKNNSNKAFISSLNESIENHKGLIEGTKQVLKYLEETSASPEPIENTKKFLNHLETALANLEQTKRLIRK